MEVEESSMSLVTLPPHILNQVCDHLNAPDRDSLYRVNKKSQEYKEKYMKYSGDVCDVLFDNIYGSGVRIPDYGVSIAKEINSLSLHITDNEFLDAFID